MKQGWEIKKLGEVCTFQRGLTYSKDDEVEHSNNCVLRSNNIELDSMSIVLDELKYINDDFVVSEDKKVKPNTILICMSNGSKQHIGKVAFIDKEYGYAFGGFMGLIRPNAEVSPKFIYYSCISSSYKHFLAGIGNGANITNLKFSDLQQYTLPIPSREEQERIVEELDCLSGVIEKKREQLKELDALAQSIFYQMFGDPITNEKGWEVKTIGDVCKLKSGDSSANNTSEGALPYIKVGDMNMSENVPYITTSSTLVSREENIKGIFPIGTTIFPKRGGAIFTNKKRLTTVEICCDLNTMGVIPMHEVLPLYIFHFFIQIDFGELCNGAAIPQINNIDIAPLKICVPPLTLQQEFADKIEAIEKQKELIRQSITETEELFNSRMDYYFN